MNDLHTFIAEHQMLLKTLVVAGGFLLAALIEAIILPRVLYVAYKKHLYDIPNARKIHKNPTPRLGGISFMPAIVLVLGTAAVTRLLILNDTVLDENITNQFIIYIFFSMGMMLLYLVGCVDDLVGVSYKSKFATQIIAALLPPLGGLWINNLGGLFGIYEIPIWVGMPLTMFMFIYIINAMNLIDGIDGLSSGLSILALGVIAVYCFMAGHFSMGSLAVTVIGVLCVFFKYNVLHRGVRKLFMGDAGSMTLGYVLSLLLMHFWSERADWNPYDNNLHMVVASSLIIPMFDVVHVSFVRIKHGRNPFLPDRSHIHHRLMATGLSPLHTLAVLLGIALLFVAANIALAPVLSPTGLLATDVAMWFMLSLCIHTAYTRHERMAATKN